MQRSAPLIYLFDGPFGPRFRGIIPQQHRFERNLLQPTFDNRPVQVSDLTTNGGAGRPRTDEPASSMRDARGRARPNKPFREAFKQAGAGQPSADAAAMDGSPGWLKPEPIRVGPPASKIGPAAAAKPAAATETDRVLIGSTGEQAEARIRIGVGALAGSEIRLTTTAGSQAVTAQLLTPTAGSRQTLSVAMEEIRLRLRDKGIALASSVARRRPENDTSGDGRGDSGRDRDSGRRDGSGDSWQGGR
jgi:hypothetical protein